MMKSTFTQLLHSRSRAWLILLLCLGWSIAGYGQKTIALFYDSGCVGTGMSTGDEGYTMRTDLENLGHTVNTFTGSTGAEWAAGLAGAELLVIPETENCTLTSFLDADAQNELVNYVNDGGGLILSYSGSVSALMNGPFGFSLGSGSASSPITYNAAGASGTTFDGSVATLSPLSATGAYNNLPAGGQTIYESDSGDAVVATFTYNNSGQIVILGWDWFQGGGDPGEIDDWRTVLEQAVNFVAACQIVDAVFTIEQAYGPTCFNGNDGAIFLEFSGGIPPYTYNWDDAPDIQDPFALPAGTYTLRVIDSLGCKADTSITLNDPDSLGVELTILQVPNCDFQTMGEVQADVTGGTSPFTFEWSNGYSQNNVTTSTATGLIAGPVIVTVTDGNGCEQVAATQVADQYGLDVVVSIVNLVSCNGEADGSLTAQGLNGAQPYEYDWDIDGSGDFDDPATIADLPTGLHVVRVRDANNCTAQTTFYLDEPTPLFMEIAFAYDETCDGSDDGSASVNATGGTPPYTYNWLQLAQSTPFVEGLPDGTYTVRVTDANDCRMELDVVIGTGDGLEISPINNLNYICLGDATMPTLLNANPANPNTVYSWTGGASIGLADGTTTGINPAIPSFIPTAEGTVTITLSADLFGCTDTFEFDIFVGDDAAPTFLNCPSSVVRVGNDVDDCSALVNWSIPVAVDNCDDNVSVVQTAGPNPGTTVSVGTTFTVTYTATDDAGNSSTCSFDVEVIDTQEPELDADVVMPGDITVECDAIPDPFILTNNDVNDNCTAPADLNIIYDEVSDQDPDPANCGHYTYGLVRTWTVVDSSGNEFVHVREIAVEDTTDPEAVCMDITVTLDIYGNASITPEELDGGSTDNCAASAYLDFAASQTEFDCSDLGQNSIVLTVTDPCGNSSTCVAIVTVVEGIAPCNPEYDVLGSDPCVCLDNATTLENGQFSEFIQIESLAGQTWSVSSSTGFFSVASAAPPAAPTPIANGMQLTNGLTDGLDNDGDTQVDEADEERFYTLEGIHVDGQGYIANLGNDVFQSISIANTCYYPTPFFANLAGPYCFSTVPFEVEVEETNGASGSVVAMTIGGVTTTILDPVALGSGFHTIEATFDAGSATGALYVDGVLLGPDLNDALLDPGCEQTITTQIEVVETPDVIACNDLVHVSLDASCEAEITADMVLEGNYICYDDYSVQLSYPFGTNTYPGQNIIDETHIGYTFGYTLVHLISGNVCWGEVQVEDKIAPSVDCPGTVQILCTQDADNLLLTGTVAATDCSSYSAEYSDEIFQYDCAEDALLAQRIIRTWIVTDAYGNSSSCVQEIEVLRGQIDHVSFPSNADFYCNALPTNLGPAFAGWPQIAGVDLTDQSTGGCGLAVSYTDDLVNTCPGSYKIIRTWTVYDWCPPSGGDPTSTSHIQYIKVEDVAPVITLPTTNYDADNDWYLVSANGQQTEPHQACVALGPLPFATVTDACNGVQNVFIATPVGNTSNGGALPAPGLEQGTYNVTYTAEDECGNITNLTVTIHVVDDIAPVAICDEITSVDISSDGVSEVSASVFDDGSYDNCCFDYMVVRRMDGDCNGNFDDFGPTVDFCCSDVGAGYITVVFRVFDCEGNYNECMVLVEVEDKIPPVTVYCPPNQTITCDDYLDNYASALEFGDYSVLDQFGEPQFIENCTFNLNYSVAYNVNNCGEGTITRSWTATDAAGNIPATCTQTIFVNHVSDWVVEFPADINAVCTDGELPAFGEPEIFFDECELVATSFEDIYYYIVPDACYKIERTWTVINWCVFEDYGTNIYSETGFAEENLFVDWDGDGDFDDRTFRDGYNTSGTPGTADGYITYKQIIKVVDTEAPSFTVPTIDGCIVESDCDKTLVLPYPEIADDCSPSFDVTISGDFGTFAEITEDQEVLNVGLGTYEILYTVTDQCGNIEYESVTIEVTDCKKPTPYCKNGVVVEIMQTGMIEVWATDLDNGSFDNCPGTLQYSFSQDVNETSVTFTCDDLGLNEVELWITDASGNQDFCLTTVYVQDNMGACSLPASSTVAGALMTEDDDPVEGAMVEVNAGSSSMMTETDGSYTFDLGNGGDYTITPSSGDDWMNGVTTWDLVLIMRHILGVQPLDSPYKLIAADANHSDAVTTTDIVDIQKVILGIQNGFSNNESWRYIDQAHQFSNWQNPWSEPFNEFLNYNNLAGDQFGADFVAVKIGDVNGSVQANSWSSSEDRTMRDQLRLGIENRWVEPGEMVQIPVWVKEVSLLGMQATFTGKQGLEILGVTPSVGIAANFAQAGKMDQVSMSWYQAQPAQFENELFFYLNVVADRAGELQQMLSLAQDPVASEAYNGSGEALDLELVFLDADYASVKLYQNRPNPFRESTVIGFDLPESGIATLEIINTDGKILQAYRNAYQAGYHEVKVDNLPQGGVLYYRLRTEAITLTRKMIILNK